MSVAEMKLAAINEISKLENEAEIKEILDHLAKLSKESHTKFDTSGFFEMASKKYDDILQKLAQ
ncbi:MAG: hypothetical protein JST86_01200 [Bacteroidetes bacterium]|nr:hypothetical protein [Bacteroidota bacterium]